MNRSSPDGEREVAFRAEETCLSRGMDTPGRFRFREYYGLVEQTARAGGGVGTSRQLK